MLIREGGSAQSVLSLDLGDLQAADAVGAQPILVMTGKGRKTRAEGGFPERTRIASDLAEVAEMLCQ